MTETIKPHCGECCFCLHEDARGYGYCILVCCTVHCGDKCVADYANIQPRQIAKALHHCQKWRRGAKTAMPQPYVLGKVIDAAIRTMRLYGSN